MVINNSSLITTMLDFSLPNTFYFIEIIKRKKENPEMKTGNKKLKSYYVYSKEYMLKIFPEIQKLCKAENARAYINLNRRDSIVIHNRLIQQLIEYTINRVYSYNINGVYDSVCGKYHAASPKLWVVDVDIKEDKIVDLLAFEIRNCTSKNFDPIRAFVPTLNGYHIITEPFNVLDLELPEEIPYSILKDNGTLLYYSNEKG